MEDNVILVDGDDVELGALPKLQAHREGRLHRAISVFVLNRSGEILLQKRAAGKYHSALLWSNTCCTHPRPGEDAEVAAVRRLREEMGLECRLERVFSFIYRAELGGGLQEHELDHVFVGRCDGEPEPDPREVAAWRWTPLTDVQRELAEHPGRFTAWFPLALEGLIGQGEAFDPVAPPAKTEDG
jgi:isopentenyl-diphosphate Delta-isomerase